MADAGHLKDTQSPNKSAMRCGMNIRPMINFEQALAPQCAPNVMRMTIAAVFVATLTLSGSAQEFIRKRARRLFFSETRSSGREYR